jgi:hypothetical protein
VLLPSVIVSEEWIALISPRHADAAKMSGLGHSTIRLQRVFRGRMI